MALLDQLSATTREAFIGINEELKEVEYAAANMFLNNAKTDQVGRTIIFDVLYERLGGGWFSGYDTFNMAETERITQGEVEWAEVYVPLQIDGTTLKKQGNISVSDVLRYSSLQEIPEGSGKNTLVNILNSQIKQAKNDAKHLIAKAIHGSGGGKVMDGFGNIIEADTADYAGIAYDDLPALEKTSVFNSPNYMWQSKRDHNSGTRRALTWAALMTMWADIRIGSDAPTDVFCDSQMFNAVVSIAAGENVTMVEDKRYAELNFEHVKIRGGPTFIVDDYNAQYKLWWNNNRHMWCQQHPIGWEFTGWKVPEDQNALIAQLIIMLNLVCDDKAKFGLMDDYEP